LSGESDGYINVQKIKSNAVGTFTDNLDFVKRALRLLVKSDTSANPSGGGPPMMGRVPITYEDDDDDGSESSQSSDSEEVVVAPVLAVGKNSQNEKAAAAAEPTVHRRYWALFTYIFIYMPIRPCKHRC
jgi:hypothetical protein